MNGATHLPVRMGCVPICSQSAHRLPPAVGDDRMSGKLDAKRSYHFGSPECNCVWRGAAGPGQRSSRRRVCPRGAAAPVRDCGPTLSPSDESARSRVAVTPPTLAPAPLSPAPAVEAALAVLPSIVGSVTDGTQAVSLALAAASSARRAFRADDHALAAARFRRAEKLLISAHGCREEALGAARAVASSLSPVVDHLAAARMMDLRHPTWNSLSESWWEERRLGLRWRLLALADVLHAAAGGAQRPSRAVDYVCQVQSVQQEWTAAKAELDAVLLWTRDWSELACLVASGTVGEDDVHLRQPSMSPK
jgi:hypothetical protein